MEPAGLPSNREECYGPRNGEEETEEPEIPICGGGALRHIAHLGQLPPLQRAHLSTRLIQWIYQVGTALEQQFKKATKRDFPFICLSKPKVIETQ